MHMNNNMRNMNHTNNNNNANNTMDEEDCDPQADAAMMAHAFRQANDEDTRLALNAISSRGGSKTNRNSNYSNSSINRSPYLSSFPSSQQQQQPQVVPDMTYYAVPVAWMQKAWNVLMKQQQNQQQQNQRKQHTFSNDNNNRNFNNDDSNNNPIPLSSNWRNDVIGTIRARHFFPSLIETVMEEVEGTVFGSNAPNNNNVVIVDADSLLTLVHAKDYVLVGSNLWLLVKEKFGCDYEDIKWPVVELGQEQQQEQQQQQEHNHSMVGGGAGVLSGLAVRTMTHAVHVPIPATGRFPYETWFDTTYADNKTNAAAATPPPADEYEEKIRKRQQAAELANAAALAAREQQRQQRGGPPQQQQQLRLAPLAAVPNGGGGGPQQQHLEQNGVGGVAADADVPLEPPPGNVSDDEEEVVNKNKMENNDDDEGDDLFPGEEDRMSVENKNNINPIFSSSSSPVLLLPAPSSSSISNTMANGSSTMNGNGGGGFRNYYSNNAVLRPYGSGLGNLGNTCFMNSTLQCLAHTDPLRKYFLSGAYQADLNTDNPLGTGGDLAIQFAQLLADMWAPSSSNTTNNYSYNNVSSDSFLSHVVYPRSFKYTLGRHAEQFMGYDQHDSQELATYLLDALHEDSNRVTHKPYVEKPEQAEGESDQQAAEKAWELHLRREDSKVMEYFMGQVKSRVQCCKASCGRVSTTFDPFMYLSVPIPGSSERTLKAVFVPLDPMRRPQEITVHISKQGTVGDLVKLVIEYVGKLGILVPGSGVALEDLYVADVWQKEIYSVYDFKNDLDKIRDNDETVIYQLEPGSQIQEQERAASNLVSTSDLVAHLQLRERSTPKKYKLDVGTMARINQRNGWANELTKYLRNELAFSAAFNPKRGNAEERVKFFHRLCTFIDQCYQDIYRESEMMLSSNSNNDLAGGAKRMRTLDDIYADTKQLIVSPDEAAVQSLVERSQSSPWFDKVSRRYDLAVLEFLAAKVKNEIIKMEREKPANFPQGIVVQIRMRKSMAMRHKENNIATSFALRIPSTTTVYGLREILATRLARVLRTSSIDSNSRMPTSSGESTSERPALPVDDEGDGNDNDIMMTGSGSSGGGGPPPYFGRPELLILRQIPLTYEQKSLMSRPMGFLNNQLGVLEKSTQILGGSGRPVALASPTDEDEQILVAEVVGNEGIVYMEWPETLADRYFDSIEYESIDRPTLSPDNASSSSDTSSTGGRIRRNEGVVDVYECIEKYCQREQLEESEMWYCNQCKEHVRAWKQFHLYRCPKILIVHLKRFQYSATTHRRDKINLFIDFPLTGLDLTSHVTYWAPPEEEGVDEKPIYDCYAVSNHYGGLGGGHYTAYCLNDDGVWCYYDDSRVTTNVDPKEVVSASAYVLYYRRRDVPVGEVFPLNLQTAAPPGAMAQALRGTAAPALIQDPDSNNVSSDIVVGAPDDVSSSNAAMVDEEDCGMEVEDDDVGGSGGVLDEVNSTANNSSNHDLDTASRSPSLSMALGRGIRDYDDDDYGVEQPLLRDFRKPAKGNSGHQSKDSFPLQ